MIAAAMSACGLIHQPQADFTFQTFTKGAGGFGTSPCAFMIGYMTQAAAFVILALVQAAGSKRVPPEIPFEQDEDEQIIPRRVAGSARRAMLPRVTMLPRVMYEATRR